MTTIKGSTPFTPKPLSGTSTKPTPARADAPTGTPVRSGGWSSGRSTAPARTPGGTDSFQSAPAGKKMVGAGTPFVTPDMSPDDTAPSKKIVGAGTPFVTPDMSPDDTAPSKKIVGAGTPFVTPDIPAD